MNNTEIENLRKDYSLAELNENNIDKDPFKQFDKWFNQALSAKLNEANAMALATATPDGKPSLRIVLLKGFSSEGFIFYTNYKSRKGNELTENPYAAITFFWSELQRQVRIEGRIEKVSKEKSEEYFHSRPKGSQIGAVVSHQSQIISGRQELEERYHELEKQYENSVIPKPEYWGGFILVPENIEFWQGRTSRLHDRINFKKENDLWQIFRLSP